MIKSEHDAAKVLDFRELDESDQKQLHTKQSLEVSDGYTSRYLVIEQRAFLNGSIHGPISKQQLEQQYSSFLEQGRQQKHVGMSDKEYAERRIWESCCR